MAVSSGKSKLTATYLEVYSVSEIVILNWTSPVCAASTVERIGTIPSSVRYANRE